MPARVFGERLDLARRNALDIHLGQRRHQRPLRPLVALEQLGREAPGTVLRHPQLQLADPRHQRARVMPRTVRSEEHTSELQSLMRISYAVFCLKKNKKQTTNIETHTD